MSDDYSMSDAQPDAKPERKQGAPARAAHPLDGLKRRWPLYVGLFVIALLAIAYIDAGEEPIRPIVQPVALPSTGVDQ